MFKNNKDIKYGYETSKFLKWKKNHSITKEETLKNFLIVGREAQKAQNSFIEKYLETKSGFVLFDFSEDDSYLEDVKKIVSVYKRQDDLIEFKGMTYENILDINEIITKNKIAVIKSDSHEIRKIFSIFEKLNHKNKNNLGYPVFLNEWNFDLHKSEELKASVDILNSNNISVYLTKDNFFYYDGLKGYYDRRILMCLHDSKEIQFRSQSEIWIDFLCETFRNTVVTTISTDEVVFMFVVWNAIYESYYRQKDIEGNKVIKLKKAKRINISDFSDFSSDHFKIVKSHQIFFQKYTFDEPKIND